jgi:hypothetical protein
LRSCDKEEQIVGVAAKLMMTHVSRSLQEHFFMIMIKHEISLFASGRNCVAFITGHVI